MKVEDYEYTVNFLAAVNDAYLQMKIAHYTNIQQLLIELVPYDYRFTVESDDVGKLTDYSFSKDRMSDENTDAFWREYGHLTLKELGEMDTGDAARNEVIGRLYHISSHLADDDIEAVFRKYGTSKQAYRQFCDGLGMQLYYAKLRKEDERPRAVERDAF